MLYSNKNGNHSGDFAFISANVFPPPHIKKYTRLSFVCYLREKIINCPNVEDIDPRFLTKSGHSKIKDIE